MWVILGLIVAGVYYTKGLEFLTSIADSIGYFKVKPVSPLVGIKNFLLHIEKLPGLVFKSFFSRFAMIPILIGAVIRPKKSFILILFLISIQCLTIFALDEHHAYTHEYYFIGATFHSFFVIEIIENAHKNVVN